MSEFVTPAELASELGMHPERVRLLCVRGEVAGARRLGRRWRIHRPTFVASFSGTPEKPGRLRVVRHRLEAGALARIASSVG